MEDALNSCDMLLKELNLQQENNQCLKEELDILRQENIQKNEDLEYREQHIHDLEKEVGNILL